MTSRDRGVQDSSQARKNAKRFWATPAGTHLTEAEPGTREFFEQMTETRYREQPWHPRLLADFGPTGRLLEIGCGAGTDHMELATMADETYAVDLAEEGVALTNLRLRLAGLPQNARVADAEELPFAEGFFDEVYSFGVIHHTDHPERVAAEIARVLKSGGRFMVAVYNRHSIPAIGLWVRWLRSNESWSDYLGRIEHGGASRPNRDRPHVRLYGRREARHLFTRTECFEDVTSRTVHAASRWRLPPAIGAIAGWYIVITGVRKQRSS